MRARASLFLTAMVAACAAQPAAGPGPATGPTTVTRTGSDVIVHLGAEPAAGARVVPASADAVWAALPAAFAELGLPAGAADARTRSLASGVVVVNRRFAGESAGAFFDCGRTMTGEPAANAYRVTLSVRASLEPDGAESTRVRTAVEAGARSPEGTSAAPVRCLSTGRLEQRLAEALLRALAKG